MRRRGTSTPNGSGAPHTAARPSSLDEPAACERAIQVAEDDDVAPACRDELPVAAPQRPLGPPAVLDEPRLANLDDLSPVDLDRGAARRSAGGRAHAPGPRKA